LVDLSQFKIHKPRLNNILRNHIIVIIFFTGFTGLFTFPSFFTFSENKIIGNFDGDPSAWMNSLWWFNYSVSNPTNQDFTWLYNEDYQFYPKGAPLNELGLMHAYLSIPLMYLTQDIIKVYNLLIYLSFIFTGYGTFLLANYLTRNYYASLIAGLIFCFSSFHMFHLAHLSYLMTLFIPFTVLFLIKTIDFKNIKNPIIAGIFLSLVFISSFYLGFFMLIFLASFLLYIILRKESFQTFVRFGIVILIAVSLTLPLLFGHFVFASEAHHPNFDHFVGLSADLENYFLPSVRNSFYNIMGYQANPDIIHRGDTQSFLGYTAIFLMIIALIKIDKKRKSLWIISGILAAIISLGPLLQINGLVTNIQLPYYFLYELPYFEVFRALGRASVIVIFSVSILAAYGINEIYKIKRISEKKKLLVIGIIGVFIIIEALTIPLPQGDISVPEIYYEIGSDSSDFVILDAPIGRYIEGSKLGLEINQANGYYQSIHEKPIYAGTLTRMPPESERYVQTYFLNQFIWNQTPKDIISQDLEEVGISLFNNFDIGYVIVRYELTRVSLIQQNVESVWIPQTKTLLLEIFSRPPDFENDELFAYKVEKSTSQVPFLTLGQEWSTLLNHYRTIGNQGTINVVNPTNDIKEIELEIELVSPTNNKIHFSLNEEEIFEEDLQSMTVYQTLLNLTLHPGTNKLVINSEEVTTSKITTLPYMWRQVSLDDQVGIAVNKISINLNPKTNSSASKVLEDQTFAKELTTYTQINEVYLDTLNRNATPESLKVVTDRIMNYGNDLSWLEELLKNSKEYKKLESIKDCENRGDIFYNCVYN